VPLIVVSAYTPAGYINNEQHNFDSVLGMIEGINHLPEGQLDSPISGRRPTYADSSLSLNLAPNPVLPAEKEAKFLLTYPGAAIDPDDDQQCPSVLDVPMVSSGPCAL